MGAATAYAVVDDKLSGGHECGGDVGWLVNEVWLVWFSFGWRFAILVFNIIKRRTLYPPIVPPRRVRVGFPRQKS